MKRQLTITTEPIDEAALLAQRSMSQPAWARWSISWGWCAAPRARRTSAPWNTKRFSAWRSTRSSLLFDEMARRWPIESVRLVHRVGVVKVNEPSLWVEVVAPHRGEAFAACQWLIDELKRVVPIWKKPVAE